MKFNLRIQVFLVFACFAVLLTGGLFIYSRLSFERGFNHYMEQKEASRNARLIMALEQHFTYNGNWDAFKVNPHYWELFVWQYSANMRQRGERPIPFPFPPELDTRIDGGDEDRNDRSAFLIRKNTQDARRDDRRAPPQPDDFLRHQPYKRFILLDHKEKIISGKKWRNETYFFSDLYINIDGDKKLVGYLGTPMNPALRDLRDNEFAKRQQNHFLLMAMVALAIALACAIPLSYLLTQRVKKLATHVQQLSKGEYKQRLSTKGQDEISTLAENLNHLAHTLNQTEQARKRWVADISHELRTPLAVLKADLEALEDGVRKFDIKAITRLQKHAARLTSLVNDLYQLSLTDIGAMSYRKQECDIAEIIEELSVSLQDKLSQNGLELERTLPKNPVIAFADPERLHQLFLNLFNNSINYTEAPGKIRIALSADASQARFVIEDSAPGVDPALHEKLFERLYRAESSRSRETGGAGLGLSICRNIVEAHAGRVCIETSELGGLKVSVYLPLQESA
ncbi:ATP-binding protein [Cellvibrio sp. UBA7671]|uniref:ATP-binding protein n=1 Tax=Cellvibrio sp. UBA7671 TaxID=1946312 RepID=UPI002F3610F5